MTKSSRIIVLESGVVNQLKPLLEQKGFTYTANTRTFRRASGELTQIIDIQIGQRIMEGHFAVNLGVFHPRYFDKICEATPPKNPREFHCLFEARQRLGQLHDTWLTKIMKRILSNTENSLSWWLVTPPDRWWKFSALEGEVNRSLNSVIVVLEKYGLPWLEDNSDVGKLREISAKYSSSNDKLGAAVDARYRSHH